MPTGRPPVNPEGVDFYKRYAIMRSDVAAPSPTHTSTMLRLHHRHTHPPPGC